jgi:hypothetical protein
MNSLATTLNRKRNFIKMLIKSLANESLLLNIILMIVLRDIRPN